MSGMAAITLTLDHDQAMALFDIIRRDQRACDVAEALANVLDIEWVGYDA
jgi:hypothetical protein